MMVVKLQNRIEEFAAQERGEVASWLIVAAALCAAAVLASGVLSNVISSLADNVRSSAGV